MPSWSFKTPARWPTRHHGETGGGRYRNPHAGLLGKQDDGGRVGGAVSKRRKAGDLLDDFNSWKEDGEWRNIYGESKLSTLFVTLLKKARKCKRAFIGGQCVTVLSLEWLEKEKAETKRTKRTFEMQHHTLSRCTGS